MPLLLAGLLRKYLPVKSLDSAKLASVLELTPFLYASIHDLNAENLNNALCGPSIPNQDVDLYYIITETHPGTLNPFAMKRREWSRVSKRSWCLNL